MSVRCASLPGALRPPPPSPISLLGLPNAPPESLAKPGFSLSYSQGHLLRGARMEELCGGEGGVRLGNCGSVGSRLQNSQQDPIAAEKPHVLQILTAVLAPREVSPAEAASTRRGRGVSGGCCGASGRRLQRRPTAREAEAHELMPCGVYVITDAATVAAEPAALKRVWHLLRRPTPPPHHLQQSVRRLHSAAIMSASRA